MATSSADVVVLRRFNRTYTQRIGALDDSFLGLGVPLAGARLLFEIGAAGVDLRELRDRLGLDSGYLSRLLRTLEEEGLLATTTDPTDRRRRRLDLTPAGHDALDRLETASETRAAALLDPLTDQQRSRLTAALASADLLVRAATVEITQVEPAGEVAAAAMARYVAELDARFPGGFDPGALPPPDVVVVVRSDGVVVGCGGLQELSPGVGEVKRLWVDDTWRGAGLGSRLLRHLETLARDRGHEVVRLDSHGSLVEAIAMYERAGYEPVERYNDNPYAEVFLAKRLLPGAGTGAGAGDQRGG